MTDYIVAIDLGTSHLTGIVGEKQSDGTFSIVAYDTEDPSSSIRRGNIYNLDDTASRIKSLIYKLESKLKGARIERVYIGVGGQSLRTVEHTESMEIDAGAVVTADDVDKLKRQCETYIPDLLDVLDVAPSVFYLDGRRELKPEGVSCKRLEARYKLVVGRPSIRRDILNSITERAKKEVAGIVVSPLSLSDAMLSKEEKELGCAVVDFGAGVTSVTIYKNGELLNLSVLPLGSNLITKDITTLSITEAEAEKLKKENGSAIIRKDDDGEKIQLDRDGSTKEIELNDLNAIIEARVTEIIENVMARIKDVIDIKSLGNGIVLAGCASSLKNLPKMMIDKHKVNVRFLAFHRGLVSGNDELTGNPFYMTVASVMLKGTEQCVAMPIVEQITPEEEELDVQPPIDPPIKKGKKKEKEKKKKGEGDVGWVGRLFGEIFTE
ncbi:MAG: cell division protein FtsA [Tannerella sp.]|jgi:cell division protein FtsA|nr:cell division protein FtsA [Tannerella sp.]